MTASSESTNEVSTLQEKTNCFSKIGNGIKCLLILGHISARQCNVEKNKDKTPHRKLKIDVNSGAPEG
jgi:hypothetical protein